MRGRRHVHHVLDAVDLLLDGRGDGLGDDLALAPGYWQVTDTVGGAIWGNIAIGKARIASPPASVITIERTEAKIGRSMKKRVNTVRTRDQIRSREGSYQLPRRPLDPESSAARVDERAGAGPGL